MKKDISKTKEKIEFFELRQGQSPAIVQRPAHQPPSLRFAPLGFLTFAQSTAQRHSQSPKPEHSHRKQR